MNSFAFSASMPPSSNMMFITVPRGQKGLGRFPSPAYKAWTALEKGRLTKAWELGGSPSFDRHLSLTIHLGLNYTGDIDNRVKPLIDLIGKAIPDFPDDRYIDRIAVERVPEIQGARVLIMQGCPPWAVDSQPPGRFREAA